MTTITRLATNADTIIRFLLDWAKPESKDIEFSWVTPELDDDGNNIVETYTQPSFFKFMSQVGMKYDNDTKKIVGLDDTPLEIDATTISGKDIDYLKSVAGVRFKMIFDTTEFQGFPERFMFGVTGTNEIYTFGRNSSCSGQISGVADDSQGYQKVAIPSAKRGVNIGWIGATNWTIFVLFEDGDLYSMGYNNYGQCGVGNTTTQCFLNKVNIEVPIVKIASSAHGYHQNYNTILAIDENGDLWAWGSNGYGQCGNGTTTNIYTPQKIVITGLESDEKIKDIYATSVNVVSSYILTTAGRVFSAGWNGNGGALGLGDTTNRSEFTLVTGLLTGKNIIKLATGGGTRRGDSAYYRHSVVALTDEGRLFSWGYGGNSELGCGNTNSVASPQEIATGGMLGKVVDIVSSRGSYTSYIALTDTGVAYGWGENYYGCLSVDTTATAISTPTELKKYNSDGTINSDPILQVYFGAGGSTYSYHHTSILRTADKIFASGYAGEGQTAQNNTTTIYAAKEILFEHAKNIIQISTGGYSSAFSFWALLDDGRLYGWGDNDYQQVMTSTSTANLALPNLTIQ